MTSKKEISVAEKEASERGIRTWNEWKLLLNNYPIYDQDTIEDRAAFANVAAIVENIERERLTKHQLIWHYAIAVYSRKIRLNRMQLGIERRKQLAKKAADMLHSKPGGNREKQNNIRAIWASGKYTSRDICAEQECAANKMSFSAARKALRNTPDPT